MMRNNNEYFSDNDSESISDSEFSNDDEFFVKFESVSDVNNIEYISICSTCYEFEGDNECQHDVIINYSNGNEQQCILDKKELQTLLQENGINLAEHEIFQHLLE
jgi:hypothetical protein